jgi:hypothetical protein
MRCILNTLMNTKTKLNRCELDDLTSLLVACATRRRNVERTAIGLTPSPFFVNAHSEAPYKIGCITDVAEFCQRHNQPLAYNDSYWTDHIIKMLVSEIIQLTGRACQ